MGLRELGCACSVNRMSTLPSKPSFFQRPYPGGHQRQSYVDILHMFKQKKQQKKTHTHKKQNKCPCVSVPIAGVSRYIISVHLRRVQSHCGILTLPCMSHNSWLCSHIPLCTGCEFYNVCDTCQTSLCSPIHVCTVEYLSAINSYETR